MTESEPAEVMPLPITFTIEDRRMLQEIHNAITSLEKIVSEVVPSLGKSPIGRMLGL